MAERGHKRKHDDGPYLMAALFCERVLKDADGTLSAIRIVDRVMIWGPTDHISKYYPLQLSLMVSFVSGKHRGKSSIKLLPITPSGKQLGALELPVVFNAADGRSIGATAQLVFPVNEAGLYWFEVSLDENLVTKIPLEVQYQKGENLPHQNH